MKGARRWIGILAVIFLLVLLDQGVKVAVDRLVPPVEEGTVLVSVEHPVDVRIAPTLHAKVADNLSPLAARWGWMCAYCWWGTSFS